MPRGRTKWFAIGALAVALGGFLFLAVGGIGENLVYYWAPKDVHAAGNRAVGASIRLGGQVATGSVKWEGTSDLEFDVTDGTATVHVVSKGVPPQLFRDRIGVVVEGTMTAGRALREPAPHGLARQPVPRARRQERGHQDPDALDPGSGVRGRRRARTGGGRGLAPRVASTPEPRSTLSWSPPSAAP